jgi:SRSO17 transposase
MSSRSEAEDWAEELEAVAGRIAPRFGRAEPRRRALAYLQGLLAPLERKNGWHLAEAAGDHTPDGMQAFLARVHWDADALRDDLRAYVVEHLGDDAAVLVLRSWCCGPGVAVLVLDETGFLKKGTKSAGVHRQYSGTAGRIENCQIGVFLAYGSRHGRALIDRALYLPQTWTDDRPRCRDAGIPDEVAFATKPKIGRAMLERAFLAHVPCAWVTGDSVYGSDSGLRRTIEAAGKGYVLTVTSAQHLGLRPVGDWAKEVPKKGWTRLSAGDGAKGPRLYDWACVPFRGAREGWQKALLIRRSLEKPDELTFYLTLAPEGTELATLVQVAGSRWTIEACFEAAKGEVGLDEYEVRSWTGWHRHVTLAMLAHAYLAVVRQHAIRGRGPRPRGRLAAPYGSRGAPAHLASRLGKAARSRSHPRLVGLATTTPAARQTITLDPQNPNSSTPAVVLERRA